MIGVLAVDDWGCVGGAVGFLLYWNKYVMLFKWSYRVVFIASVSPSWYFRKWVYYMLSVDLVGGWTQ